MQDVDLKDVVLPVDMTLVSIIDRSLLVEARHDAKQVKTR